MISTRLIPSALFSILLSLSPARSQEDPSGKDVSAKAVAVSEAQLGWTTQAILSSYVNDNQVEGYMDLLIPLLQNDDGMLFLYPRFGLSSDVDPGYSLGLGARHHIAAIDAIIGGNAFFDRYDSPGGNYYNQLGLGLEVLSRWVDARFNYYIPDSSPNVVDTQSVRSRSVSTSSAWGQPYATGYTIRQPQTTTTRTTTVNQLFERFEDSMEGLDAEVGVLTPWLEQYVALRWFAGYYDFNNSYASDISGVKGRAELRFSEKLAVDATYYQDEQVTGSKWLFGVRMTIPVFMENLADGRSPFEGSFSGMFDGVNLGGRGQGNSGILRGGSASSRNGAYAAMSPFAALAPAPTFAAAGTRGSTVRDRMVEEVMRLSDGARTSQSGFIENVGKRNIDVDIEKKTRTVVVEDSIVFVSNGNGTAGNPGTFENPLDTIQGGVNRASTLFANRGDVFVSGTGANYSGDGDDVVSDAGSSVRIWGGARGFPVNGGRSFTHGSQPVLDGGFIIKDIPAFLLSGFTVVNGNTWGDGILVKNVGEVDILWNTVRDTGDDSILMEYWGSNRGNIRIVGNNVVNAGGIGLNFDFEDDSVGNLFVDRNQISGSGDDGIYLGIWNNSVVTGRITNNLINGGDSGMAFGIGDTAVVDLTLDRNQIFNPAGEGIYFGIWDDAVVTGLITNNLINGTGDEGLSIDQEGNSYASMRILSNRMLNAGSDPLDIDLEDNSFGRYQVARNVFSGSSGDIDIDSDDSSTLHLQIFGNTSNRDFDFDELGGSTFRLEDTLGTNVLTGGAIFDIDANILPVVPFGSFSFPAP